MLDIKTDEGNRQQFFTQAIFVLFFLLFVRIIANYYIPLNDSTEARYAEIARKMLETGNWVNLLHDYGIPFWAKPPLSTWLSALSMKLFGINEFALRLPGLFLSLGVLWLVWDLAKKQSGSLVAMVSVLVLASTVFFFINAGTVMTDPSLLFCTTLSMAAFWQALVYQNKIWSYLFFVGLGLGLLAKGPIALVLVGLPIFFWVLLRGHWGILWERLPWIKGGVLAILIALPWYVLAEIRTPGFLNYFIIGEHFNRFLVPGWSGDKYGMAHHAPKGMIWIYALAGIFPWNILGGKWLLKGKRNFFSVFEDKEGWMSYCFLCMLAPLLFFTFAGNIIYPYVFPSLPGFALFFSGIWATSDPSIKTGSTILKTSLVCGVLFLGGAFIFEIKPEWIAKTQKPIIQEWINQHPTPGSLLIYWLDKTDFSAQFYSSGKARATLNAATLQSMLSNHLDNYLIFNVKLEKTIPENLLSQCKPVKTIKDRKENMLMVHCPQT